MQLEFFDVPSPCIGICESDSKGLCIGCFRTRAERQSWINLSAVDKKKVIKRCIQRKRRKNLAAQPKHSIDVVNVDKNNQHLQQPSLLEPLVTKAFKNSTDEDFSDFEL